MHNRLAARYETARKVTGGSCPLEAGVIGRLADHECRHGRLPGDHTRPCGCWPAEHAAVIALPTRPAGEPRAESEAA